MAQSATQQNNERMVKRASFVRATGKSERNANLYCIAANGFFSEIRTTEKDESTDATTAAVSSGAEETHEKRQRGVRRGPEKANAFVRTVGEKLGKLAKISTEMGHEAFRSRMGQIKKNLTTEEHSYVGQRAEKKLVSLVEHRNNVPNNTRLRQSGFDMPILLLGRHPYAKLIKHLHEGGLDMELLHRNITVPARNDKNKPVTFTEKKILLAKHETTRLQGNENAKEYEKSFEMLCEEARSVFKLEKEM